MQSDKKIKFIKAVLEANPLAQLTGGEALVSLQFKVRREPADIDFWVPKGTHFIIVAGMSYPKSAKQIEQEKAEEAGKAATTNGEFVTTGSSKPKEKHFENEDYIGSNVTRYEYEGIKVEVHEGSEGEVREPKIGRNYFRCSSHLDIIKAKLKFIRTDSPTKERHRNDVIFFLSANF